MYRAELARIFFTYRHNRSVNQTFDTSVQLYVGKEGKRAHNELFKPKGQTDKGLREKAGVECQAGKRPNSVFFSPWSARLTHHPAVNEEIAAQVFNVAVDAAWSNNKRPMSDGGYSLKEQQER